MFRSIQGPEARSRIFAAAAAAVAAVGLTACAASGGTPAATQATTVTQTAQASPAPAASNPAAPASTAAALAATAAAPSLPEYKPSTFLSSGSDTTVVLSPDSVDKVTAFYENALKSGGWQWHATARSRWSAHFEATKGSAHAVIQISSTGNGASIAVTIIK